MDPMISLATILPNSNFLFRSSSAVGGVHAVVAVLVLEPRPEEEEEEEEGTGWPVVRASMAARMAALRSGVFLPAGLDMAAGR